MVELYRVSTLTTDDTGGLYVNGAFGMTTEHDHSAASRSRTAVSAACGQRPTRSSARSFRGHDFVGQPLSSVAAGSPSVTTSTTSIFYLAHDLNDPAIARRTQQLKRGGARIKLAGFRREDHGSGGSQRSDFCLELGRTRNGRLGQRVLSVFFASVRVWRWSRHARDCNIIIARSLEMLVLGALLKFMSRRRKALVYECLDIHRLMLSRSIKGLVLRFLEVQLTRRCSSLVVSSPAFIECYFKVYHPKLPAIFVWENRMLEAELKPGYRNRLRAPRQSWKIGWFGVIRCERSLAMLTLLCQALPGVVEVHIRGRPTKDLAPRIAAAAASHPGLIFGGPYERDRDLDDMYGGVHFAWTIDFYEEDGNSKWLLPNRLYEGLCYGAIPIALRDVETGRWMSQHSVGVLLSDDYQADLYKFFVELDHTKHGHLAHHVDALEVAAYAQSDDELRALVRNLSGLGSRPIAVEARRS